MGESAMEESTGDGGGPYCTPSTSVSSEGGKCNKDCSSLKKYILLLLNQADIHTQMRNPNKLLF